MFAGRTSRFLVANVHNVRWFRAKKYRCLSTTVQHAYVQENYILKDDIELQIPEVSIQDFIWNGIDRWPDKSAVVCNETGRSYTFAELRRRSNNLAKALRGRLKLNHGDIVAILLPNTPEFAISLLGIIEGGMVVTTVNPVYKSEEIARQIIETDTKAIVTLGTYYQRALDATKAATRNIPILTIKSTQAESTHQGAIDFGEMCTRETEFNEFKQPHIDDTILLPFSSGTTGLPKGVELTHKNIVSNLNQMIYIPQIFRETTYANQDIVPAILPMFHIYGLQTNIFKALQIGCKTVTVPKFTPEIFVQMLENHKPHHLFIVPPIVIFSAAHPSVTKKHLDSVQTIFSGAAPLGASDVERLFEKTEREIVSCQGYGMTETSPLLCMTDPARWKDCLGSIGVTVPNTEIKIVALDDTTGTPLGPNKQGEIYVRGPQVMSRYYNNVKATEDVFQDGWLKTGDMAYYDDKKILWITDRLKELIKVKGFQVAPAELEEIIRDHPDVADAAVIGIPDILSGEVPKAFIVAKPNVEVNTQEIQDYVAKKVASYKRLEGGITVIDAIPKNPSGKIMRRVLKLEYADK